MYFGCGSICRNITLIFYKHETKIVRKATWFLEQCICFGRSKDDFKVVWLVHIPMSVKRWIEFDMSTTCIAGLDERKLRGGCSYACIRRTSFKQVNGLARMTKKIQS
jgi:hypothetical protein